jgi:hypothetical protein
MSRNEEGADGASVDAPKSEPRRDGIGPRRTEQAGTTKARTRRSAWPDIRPNLRRAEVATLRRHRAATGQPTASIDAAIADGRAYSLPDRALGDAVGFSFDEYSAVGQASHRHLSTIRPYDVTQAEIAEYLRALHRPRRAQRARQRRAAAGAEQQTRRELAGDLDCRDSAVLAVTTDRWRTIAELMRDLRRSPAFRAPDGKQLTGNSLRRAITRTLRVPALVLKVETRTTIEKHGRPALLIRRRTPEIPVRLRGFVAGTLGQTQNPRVPFLKKC